MKPRHETRKCPGCCNNQGTTSKRKTISEIARTRIINRVKEEVIQIEMTRYLNTPEAGEEIAAVLKLPFDTLQPIINRLKNTRNLHQQVNNN